MDGRLKGQPKFDNCLPWNNYFNQTQSQTNIFIFDGFFIMLEYRMMEIERQEIFDIFGSFSKNVETYGA